MAPVVAFRPASNQDQSRGWLRDQPSNSDLASELAANAVGATLVALTVALIRREGVPADLARLVRVVEYTCQTATPTVI